VESDIQTPYVQGQVVYTVRVLSRVSLRQAELSEPKSADATFERLGEDKNYSSYREGQRYSVIERRYAVFPQRSGKVEIEAPVLTAALPEQGGRRDAFFGNPFGDLFQQTHPVQVRGRSLTLEVKPQPKGTGSPWLPADSLQLSETWSPDPPRFRVGEPVTRTIAITAQGLSAAQLPDLDSALPAGIKVYPDKAQTETRAEGDDLVSMKVLKQALVPSRAGKLSLPEIRLPWWDTQADRPQVTIIPAHTVEILPAPPGMTAAPPPPAAEPVASLAPTAQRPAPTVPAALALGDALRQEARLPWAWVSLTLGLAWLVTLGLWLRERRRGTRVPPAAAVPQPAALSRGKARARVEQACRANDAKAAREALLAWGTARWPTHPPRRLDALAARLGETAVQTLSELDRHLYAHDATAPWDSEVTWRTLDPLLSNTAGPLQGGGPAALPGLYPQIT